MLAGSLFAGFPALYGPPVA